MPDNIILIKSPDVQWLVGFHTPRLMWYKFMGLNDGAIDGRVVGAKKEETPRR